MRRWALIVLLLSATAQVQAQAAKSALATLKFSLENGRGCEASIREIPSSAPEQQFAISCEGKPLLTYSTGDDLVDLSRDSSAGDRIVTRWEGGSHFRMAIFHVSATDRSTTAQKVFDETPAFAPDFLVAPDVVLVYRDKRFVGSEAIPSRTDVYQWKDGEYDLVKSWKWKDDMRYADRFCVLDVKTLSCPVTPLPLK
ncbi:MAG TPA: hypothetical protein VMU57_16505 [Edaphobacter sp.]|uniref:hypothetical protein n=1 Tax=Edaphobacter sp. TaxID=1934404 RepID=UPI002C7F61F9|nr:hypothetical protein [Edaphobacter sp.]HUZ96505.1 hypothetical protein [Edaphobacter sp.]